MNFKIKNKLTVGVTGGILCGKSTALAAWKQAGAYVISCDEVVKEISARRSVQRKIQALLGTTQREALARKVFTNTAARKQLEQLLHPLLYTEIKRQLRSSKERIRVVEVPLLFEVGWEKNFDVTLAILASQSLLAKRAKQRGMTQADCVKRAHSQWSQTKKAALADICIVNDGTAADLTKKVSALYRALDTIYQVK